MKLAEGIVEELWFGDVDESRPEAQAAESFAAALARSTGLKPFPAVAQQVLSLTSAPHYDLKDLAKLIGTDPALSTAFIRIANSALYRRIRSVTSVGEAVTRLGTSTVRDIAIGVTTLGLFADSSGYGKTVRNHSVVVAAICRVLANEWSLRNGDRAMLCGLLHDIGKLLIIQTGGGLYDELAAEDLVTAEATQIFERRATGYDHAVLGAHVLQFWKLPSEIAQVVALHHQPARAYAIGGEIALTVALVRLADRIEYEMRKANALSAEFVASTGASSEAQYLGVSAADLKNVELALQIARDDAAALFV